MRTRAGRITGAPQVKAAAKRRLDQAAEALTNRLLSFALDQGVSDDDEVGCLVGRLICIPTQMSQPSITPAASSIVSSTTASLMMSAMRIRRNCRDLVRVRLINLTAEGMDGVVADAWAFGKPYSSGLDAEQWGVLFERNGFSLLGRRAVRPTENLNLFRGATEDQKRGMSWTTEVDVARSFAYDRISRRPVGNLYTATIEPEWLLASIDEGHSEKEWVVDAARLHDDDVVLHEMAIDDPRPPRRLL
jgi:hypothetical protein